MVLGENLGKLANQVARDPLASGEFYPDDEYRLFNQIILVPLCETPVSFIKCRVPGDLNVAQTPVYHLSQTQAEWEEPQPCASCRLRQIAAGSPGSEPHAGQPCC